MVVMTHYDRDNKKVPVEITIKYVKDVHTTDIGYLQVRCLLIFSLPQFPNIPKRVLLNLSLYFLFPLFLFLMLSCDFPKILEYPLKQNTTYVYALCSVFEEIQIWRFFNEWLS